MAEEAAENKPPKDRIRLHQPLLHRAPQRHAEESAFHGYKS